jgi:hypothetical protein
MGRVTGVPFAAPHLETRGVNVGEVLRWPGRRAMFVFHDLDGNRFELIENREKREAI